MNDELKKELKGSVLEKVNKEELLDAAPFGYFDKLTNNVLLEAQISKQKRNRFRFLSFNVMSIAASLLVLVSVFFINAPDPTPANLFENTENQELIEFALNEEFEDLEDEFFLDWEYTFSLSNLSDEEIDEYLENDLENIDLEQIKQYL